MSTVNVLNSMRVEPLHDLETSTASKADYHCISRRHTRVLLLALYQELRVITGDAHQQGSEAQKGW